MLVQELQVRDVRRVRIKRESECYGPVDRLIGEDHLDPFFKRGDFSEVVKVPLGWEELARYGLHYDAMYTVRGGVVGYIMYCPRF